MTASEPSLHDRRTALLRTARNVVGESGPGGAALVNPELATALAHGLAEDMGRALAERAKDVTTLDDLVEALVGASLDRGAEWQDGLAIANAASERISDYAAWLELMAPWVGSIERVIADARERGIVRQDIDTETTALVLRDTLDRMAKAAILFGRAGYSDTAAALVRAALRADPPSS